MWIFQNLPRGTLPLDQLREAKNRGLSRADANICLLCWRRMPTDRPTMHAVHVWPEQRRTWLKDWPTVRGEHFLFIPTPFDLVGDVRLVGAPPFFEQLDQSLKPMERSHTISREV